jgi:hypothetical protein
MTTVTITLSDEPMQQLKELARQAGMAPEELLRTRSADENAISASVRLRS